MELKIEEFSESKNEMQSFETANFGLESSEGLQPS